MQIFRLRSTIPDFEMETTHGRVSCHKFVEQGQPWTIFFSHPQDFTPVCTLELAQVNEEWDTLWKQGFKIIGLSCDSIANHKAWIRDILAVGGSAGDDLHYPLIADEDRDVVLGLGVLDQTVRSVRSFVAEARPARADFFVGPDMRNHVTIIYPMQNGRSLKDLKRTVAALSLVQARPNLGVPACWQPGDMLVELGSPDEWVPGKAKPRLVACPSPIPPAARQDVPRPSAEFAFPNTGLKPLFDLRLGSVVPDFDCMTTIGPMSFHDLLDREPPRTCLVSHIRDFHPVCSSQLEASLQLAKELQRHGIKLIGVSADPLQHHEALWSQPPYCHAPKELFPLIADPDGEILARLGLLDMTGPAPVPVRAALVIAANKANRLSMMYPSNIGLHTGEILRATRAVFLAADSSVATPNDWEPGDPVLVCQRVSTQTAQSVFKNLRIKDLPSGQPYLRFVDCPDAGLSR